MQRLIIIYRPPTLCFALTYRFPKCQEEWQGAVDPRAAHRPATGAALAPITAHCSSLLLPSPSFSTGNSHPGTSDRWPGYCCLWYLLVNFCNQYNIRRGSPGEQGAEAVHLILQPAAAPCSPAKLGSWPSWCGIIAAEVRWELTAWATDEWLFLIKRLSHLTKDI